MKFCNIDNHYTTVPHWPKSTIEKNTVKKHPLHLEKSTATVVEETVNINPTLLATENYKEKANNYLAITLNHLKDKKHGFNYQNIFLHVVLMNVQCQAEWNSYLNQLLAIIIKYF